MSEATTITVSVAALFALLAIIALVRSLMTRAEPEPKRYRVGFFVERDAIAPPVRKGEEDTMIKYPSREES